MTLLPQKTQQPFTTLQTVSVFLALLVHLALPALPVRASPFRELLLRVLRLQPALKLVKCGLPKVLLQAG
jgi:hypothetical protein